MVIHYRYAVSLAKEILCARILLFDRRFGTWIVKPGTTSDVLSIDVELQDRENVDLYVRTMVSYDPVDPTAIRILEFQQPIQE